MEVSRGNPTFIHIDDSLSSLIDLKHLLGIETPQYFVALRIACERDPFDLSVGELKLSLQNIEHRRQRH